MANPYWEHRAALRQAAYDRANNRVARQVAEAYERTMRQLDEDIRTIIGTYQRKTGLSVREAWEYLREGVPESVMQDLLSRVAVIQDPRERNRLEVMLRTDRYRGRISRLDAIKASTRVGMTEAAEVELGALTPHLEGVGHLAYSRTMFDIQKATAGFQSVGVPRMGTILKTNWSGQHYSRSVWANRDTMSGMLDRAMMEMASMGKLSDLTMRDVRGLVDLDKWRKQLTTKFRDEQQYAKYAANRLIRTESAYVANQATAEAFEQAEIEKYAFVSVLDGRTSHVCFVGSDKVQTLSGVEKAFRRPYSGDIITITTASKKQISGTPNHPVLTANGWLPLYEVEPSEQVLYSVLNEFTFIPRNQNVYMPTCISEVCDSVSKVTAFEVLSAGSSTTQFDGDGDFINNKVDVVSAESVLRDCAYPGRVKHVVKRLLCTAKRRGFLAALSSFCKSFDCGEVVLVTPELKVIIPGDRVKPLFTSRKLFHDFGWAKTLIKESNSPLSVKLRLLVALAALVILKEPVIFEKSSNGAHADRILLCNYSGGNTIPILEEYVVSKRVKYRTCHVYNLQTSDNTYLNDTIIVHNCQDLDGKIFDLADKEVGVNYPPMHPHCRSHAAPVIDGLEREGLMRRGRDADGKSVLLPRDMNYAEWKRWQDDGAPGDVEAWRAKSAPQATTASASGGIIAPSFKAPGYSSLSDIDREVYEDTLSRRYENGSEDAKAAYLKYADANSITEANSNRGAYYHKLDDKITMNIAEDAKNEKGTGITWFHEMGHMVDSRAGNVSKNAEFRKALRDDFNVEVQRVLAEHRYRDKTDAYFAISMDLFRQDAAASAVSDLFGGMSSNKVAGAYTHKTSYWKGDAITEEAFAHMFEASFSRLRGETMQKYFPKAWDVFEKILGGIK